MSAATQEVKFLRQLLTDMTGNKQTKGVVLYCDNQGALALAKNPVHHQRSKHIDIRYHFVRNEVQNNTLKLEYVPTADNVADVFTKSMAKPRLGRFIDTLMGT